MKYTTKETAHLYLTDFDSAMKGQRFAMDVTRTVKKFLPLMSEDDLLEMYQIMFDPENYVMRKSYKVYRPSDDIRIYNMIADEILKRQTGKISSARMNYQPDYIGIDPTEYFKN